jgi:geranylgeranyl reductase family protein
MLTDVDIAVVGGGPGGAWAARSLARAGARVTIFDPSHPREKPCGGGITGRALALTLGALDNGGMVAAPVRRARFVDTTRRQMTLVPLDTGALVVASRATFDAALLAAACHAGASLVSTRVTDVGVDRDGVWVSTAAGTVRARYLVGADGANSLVRRRLARPFRRDELSIATGFFAHGVTSDEIVIELLADPPGYIWSFPRPGHLAIGICAQADAGVTASRLRARAWDWIRQTGIAEGARLEPYSWPIPSLDAHSLRALDVAGPRWCLIGDAAGLVDPITREGIYFALASGAWAAEAIDAGRTAAYAERIRAEAVPELARAARLKAGFFQLASSGLLLRGLRHSEALRHVMADLIAGRQPYAGLRWRLCRTFEWRLAWEVLLQRAK